MPQLTYWEQQQKSSWHLESMVLKCAGSFPPPLDFRRKQAPGFTAGHNHREVTTEEVCRAVSTVESLWYSRDLLLHRMISCGWWMLRICPNLFAM